MPSNPSPEKQEQESKDDETKVKNSFLMTSSNEFIHLWELESHSLDNQLALNGEKIRENSGFVCSFGIEN